jgi:hypothetical protein
MGSSPLSCRLATMGTACLEYLSDSAVIVGLQIRIAKVHERMCQPFVAACAARVLERGEAGAALRHVIPLAVCDVRHAAFHLDQRRFIAERHRQATSDLKLLGGAIEVPGIGVDAGQPEHGVQGALFIMHLVREIQAGLQQRQRGLRPPSMRKVLPRRIETR